MTTCWFMWTRDGTPSKCAKRSKTFSKDLRYYRAKWPIPSKDCSKRLKKVKRTTIENPRVSKEWTGWIQTNPDSHFNYPDQRIPVVILEAYFPLRKDFNSGLDQ